MRLRSFALVFALVLAATPVIGVVCEMDCDQPLIPPCHESSVPADGTTVHGAPHACDHDHTDGSPARLTGATSRDSVGASFAGPPPTLLQPFVQDARLAAAATHGPPGLSGRPSSSASRITVLRI